MDRGLTADAVVTAIVVTVTRPAHEQELARAIEETPELLTGGGAKAPFPMVLKLIDALCTSARPTSGGPPARAAGVSP